MTKLRLGMIGAGRHNEGVHAPSVARLRDEAAEELELTAVCALDEERARHFQEKFGFLRVYADMREMLAAEQLDCLAVVVNIPKIHEVVSWALGTGLPVFTEKPPGANLAESKELARLADQSGSLNYVGFNRRRAPVLEKLKSWATRHGAIRRVHARMVRHRRLEERFAVGTAIHSLDFLRYLAGDVGFVHVVRLEREQADSFDFVCKLGFTSGATGVLEVMVNSSTRVEQYTAYGEGYAGEATLPIFSDQSHRAGFRGFREGELAEEAPANENDPLREQGFLVEHEAFLNAVRRGQMPDCTLQDGFHSMLLSEAVQCGYCGDLSHFQRSDS